MRERCCCACHRQQKPPPPRPAQRCDCCECCEHGPPPNAACPAAPSPRHPGTVDVPQDTPPPNFGGTPPTKPPEGDPIEIPWFKGELSGILREGPTFGKRADEDLPLLAIRARSGDMGARSLSGVFWESPDIFVLPDVDPDAAPMLPATAGGVAKANVPNTVYAHVWNLGRAEAFRARVEFYWFNPSLGIARSDSHFIGAAWVTLQSRYVLYPQWREVDEGFTRYLTRGCHAVVKCPVEWNPVYENNGHECLVVRVFEPFFDGLDTDEFSAARSRKVAQRNIAVVFSSSPAEITLPLDLGIPPHPGEAEIEIAAEAPATMEWLKLYANSRTIDFTPAQDPIVNGFLPPTIRGVKMLDLSKIAFDCREPLLHHRERFHRTCEPLQIVLHASTQNVKHGEAHVLRVRQTLDGDVLGGYTVVILRH